MSEDFFYTKAQYYENGESVKLCPKQISYLKLILPIFDCQEVQSIFRKVVLHILSYEIASIQLTIWTGLLWWGFFFFFF